MIQVSADVFFGAAPRLCTGQAPRQLPACSVQSWLRGAEVEEFSLKESSPHPVPPFSLGNSRPGRNLSPVSFGCPRNQQPHHPFGLNPHSPHPSLNSPQPCSWSLEGLPSFQQETPRKPQSLSCPGSLGKQAPAFSLGARSPSGGAGWAPRH